MDSAHSPLQKIYLLTDVLAECLVNQAASVEFSHLSACRCSCLPERLAFIRLPSSEERNTICSQHSRYRIWRKETQNLQGRNQIHSGMTTSSLRAELQIPYRLKMDLRRSDPARWLVIDD